MDVASTAGTSAGLAAGKYLVMDKVPSGTFGTMSSSAWTGQDASGNMRMLLSWDCSNKRHGISADGLRELSVGKDLEDAKSCRTHITQVHDAFMLQEEFIVAFGFADQSLRKLMEDGASLDAHVVQSWGWQLVSAIEHMHGRGILHGPIPTRTLHVQYQGHDQQFPYGKILLGDLHSAHAYQLDASPCIECWPCFLPPEMLLGQRQYTPAADLWCVGRVIDRMCSGNFGSDLNSEYKSSVCWLLRLFIRLGTPKKGHRLAQLPLFPKIFPNFQPQGWEHVRQILGEQGVSLVDSLPNLDSACRMPAHEAAKHPCFFAALPVDADALFDFDELDDVLEYRDVGLFDFDSLEEAEDVASLEEPVVESPWLGHQAESPDVGFRRRALTNCLSRDLSCERASQVHRLCAARAIRSLFGHRTGLCKVVWTFLFRKHRPADDFMPRVLHMNARMRTILVDWLSEVQFKYKWDQSVVCFAAKLCDAYLRHKPDLARTRYQLLGVTALWVAAKIKSTKSVLDTDSETIIWLCGSAGYTQADVLSTEKELMPILREVRFGISPCQFLEYFAAELPLMGRCLHVARLCLEGAVTSYELSRHTHSLLAGAACCMALRISGRAKLMSDNQIRSLIDKLEKATARDRRTLHIVSDEMYTWLYACPHLNFVRRKYSREKFEFAAKLVWPDKTDNVSAKVAAAGG